MRGGGIPLMAGSEEKEGEEGYDCYGQRGSGGEGIEVFLSWQWGKGWGERQGRVGKEGITVLVKGREEDNPTLVWGTTPPPPLPPLPLLVEQTENIAFPHPSDAGGS